MGKYQSIASECETGPMEGKLVREAWNYLLKKTLRKIQGVHRRKSLSSFIQLKLSRLRMNELCRYDGGGFDC